MLRTGCYVDFLKFNRGDKLAATTGDLLYFTGETLTVLPAGPAGQVLTSAGPGNPPVFGPAGGAVPDPLSLNRLNVNELSNFTNPGGAVRAVTPITLDYVSTGLAFGPGAGLVITTATNYTGIGSGALAALTTGADNTAVGRNALAGVVNGFFNTAVGSNALASVVAGSNNTAVGFYALENNTGSNNTALGYQSLLVNAGGASNVAIGRDCMANNSTGGENVAIGTFALENNAIGAQNVVVGASAGNLVAGSRNVILGYSAAATMGAINDIVAVGYQALLGNTIGTGNTAIGTSALLTNTAGGNNTAVGLSSLAGNTLGSNNTSLGLTSGTGVVAGNANTMIGQAAGSTVDVSNTVVVGQNAQAGANDVIVIGRAATGLVAGNIQIGANAVFSGTAQTRMRSQIVSDEAWIGSPIGYTQIDAAGNITKLVSPDLPILGEVGEFLTAPTIDATPTVLQTYATVINSTRRISAKVVGHRTGGAAGAPNDTFSVQIDSLIKNNAGVVTANTTNSIQIKDQISWVVEFFISGTNAQLRVTGAINNNITWNAWVLKFTTI